MFNSFMLFRFSGNLNKLLTHYICLSSNKYQQNKYKQSAGGGVGVSICGKIYKQNGILRLPKLASPGSGVKQLT